MIIKDAQHNLNEISTNKVKYFWNGWSIHKFSIKPGLWASKKGSFYQGSYGLTEVIEPNEKGEWNLNA